MIGILFNLEHHDGCPDDVPEDDVIEGGDDDKTDDDETMTDVAQVPQGEEDKLLDVLIIEDII